MLLEPRHYKKIAESRYFPGFLVGSSFLLMASGLVPYELVLIPSVTASPRRWHRVAVWSAIGSALGAVALSQTIRFLGWPIVDRIFPELARSAGWARAGDWISSYGGLALVAVAALPVSQAPALLLSGLLQIAPLHVLAAFLFGKYVKYGLEAYGTAKLESSLGQTGLSGVHFKARQ